MKAPLRGKLMKATVFFFCRFSQTKIGFPAKFKTCKFIQRINVRVFRQPYKYFIILLVQIWLKLQTT